MKFNDQNRYIILWINTEISRLIKRWFLNSKVISFYVMNVINERMIVSFIFDIEI